MPAPRPFALIGSADQWHRCGHKDTALVGGAVQLKWADPQADASAGGIGRGVGLAFDSQCRLFHSVPEEGRVERIFWAAADPLRAGPPVADEDDPCPRPDPEVRGDFTARPDRPPMRQPRGLAVDADDNLFVADSAEKCVWVIDLDTRRLLRRVELPAEPLDVVAHSVTVYAAIDGAPDLVRFSRAADPRPVTVPTGLNRPARLAVSREGWLFALDADDGRVWRVDTGETLGPVPGATDIEFQFGDPIATRECAGGAPVLVVARQPGADFRRFCLKPDGGGEISPLTGRAYDGLGIVRTPDGRIGFWTAGGFRHAVAPRLTFEPRGRVISFRLDSGEFHTTWGRVFLDACIPRDTDVRVHCVTADEPPEGSEWGRTLPANLTAEPPHAKLSPPMPPVELLPDPPPDGHRLHRRETGCELPWTPPPADGFATYEAPIDAPPGRFLWVVLHLFGNTRATPRVQALRAEYPGHDYLRRLPRVLSRDPDAASFLTRYLALFEGVLGELEARADARHALLDARSAPAGALPWLAGFVGLAFDERWSEPIRRQLIAEAGWLFRFRGTVPGLKRFLEIVAGREVIIVEKYRLRGTGVATTGGAGPLASTSVLGAGFRVGGSVGAAEEVTLGGTAEDAFETHAHRFAVVVPGRVCDETLDVIRYVLEVHRPAHTLVEVCTAEAGIRVGLGLHVELTSVVGPSGGFRPLRVGAGSVGREMVVGELQPSMH
jgi:phage tail-like protein